MHDTLPQNQQLYDVLSDFVYNSQSSPYLVHYMKLPRILYGKLIVYSSWQYGVLDVVVVIL